MSDGDTPPRPGVVEYLKRDTITSIMFGLRIYTIIAGVMAILNPYRYFRSLLLFYNSLQPTLHQSFDGISRNKRSATSSTNSATVPVRSRFSTFHKQH